jgi:signal transduction histidine kinase
MNPAAKEGLPAEVSDEHVEPLGVSFGEKLTLLDVAVATATAVAACGATAIILTGGVATNPTLFAAVIVANLVTLALAGLLWLHDRPSSSFGTMLLVEALLVALAALAGSAVSGVYFAGVLAGWATGLGLTWLLLAYPSGRLRGTAWIVMGLAVATFLLGELPLILTSATVPTLAAVGRCAAACPANPALAVDAPAVAHAFGHVEAALQSAWGVGILVYMGLHFARATPPRRRVLLPLYAASVPFAAAFTVNALASDLLGAHRGAGALAFFVGTRIVAPLGFIAGLLFARAYAGEALGFMARRLIGRPSVASVQELVRHVLHDPQARLVFWLPRREGYVDRHGRAVVLDRKDEHRTWRAFGHGDDRVLAIIHDSALGENQELVEAAGDAAVLALDNRRLEQDLLDSVRALRASQRRLVRATTHERRRIERDLHDGVQQQLVALRIHLELLRDVAGDESDLEGQLAALCADFDEALDELRSVSHGIYPPLLAEEGLVPALKEAGRRSSVPVVLELENIGRLDEDSEVAVYYCCLEALQNVAKHAGSEASVRLRLWRDRWAVRFSVTDDGVGFVPTRSATGAGLTNMADRIEAVGGSVSIRSAPGEGTTVEGRLALQKRDRSSHTAVDVRA